MISVNAFSVLFDLETVKNLSFVVDSVQNHFIPGDGDLHIIKGFHGEPAPFGRPLELVKKLSAACRGDINDPLVGLFPALQGVRYFVPVLMPAEYDVHAVLLKKRYKKLLRPFVVAMLFELYGGIWK